MTSFSRAPMRMGMHLPVQEPRPMPRLQRMQEQPNSHPALHISHSMEGT